MPYPVADELSKGAFPACGRGAFSAQRPAEAGAHFVPHLVETGTRA